MGRSVNYITNAMYIAYIDVSSFGQYSDEDTEETVYNEDQAQDDWECFKENIQSMLCAKYTSLCEVKNQLDGREVSIILENSLSQIGISEYCGLASISIRVGERLSTPYGAICEHWINQVWPGMLNLLAESFPNMLLNRIATASNGEAFFERAKTKQV